jgi:hypothetical protein
MPAGVEKVKTTIEFGSARGRPSACQPNGRATEGQLVAMPWRQASAVSCTIALLIR